MKEILRISRRELRRLLDRRSYLWGMVLVPLGITLFFVSLMNEGLPQPVPTAVVDLDNTDISRNLVRNLDTQQTIEITRHCNSYEEALAAVRSGEIFGFFYIPRDFARDAIAGKGPTLSYYSNMTFFVPGTLTYKGFKTMAVTTSGAIVVNKLQTTGVPSSLASSLLQPVSFDIHPLGNPWSNYNIYLSNSFAPCTLALMVVLITIFSICGEMKHKSSTQWMEMASGNVYVALAGKLLPQTAIFTVVGFAIQAILYGWMDFPLNGSVAGMVLAMFLLVIAAQSFAVFIVSIVPNLRLALSLGALMGILAFSIAGFSYPVEQMYGSIGILSYILPIRYYFLIYIDQALNGIDLYYSREYFIALLLFPVAAAAVAWNLRRQLLEPVYEP